MERDAIIKKWDAASGAWLRSLDTNVWRNQLLLPEMLELLGDVRKKRIVDIGCGDGEYARILAQKGADVLGIDGSEHLIQAARERSQTVHGTLRFAVGNASRLEGIDAGSFDIVLSAMCLMALVEFQEAIAEMGRLLTPHGRVVCSALHPCFSGPHAHVMHQHETAVYTNDQYFHEGWFEDQLSQALGTSLPFYHRTLQDFLMPFLDAGFLLRTLREPYPSDALLHEFPGTAQLRRIPMFIILEFEKKGDVKDDK
jgi:ubiquinone/menaquinone biosynthesis C-methylase UbiE